MFVKQGALAVAAIALAAVTLAASGCEESSKTTSTSTASSTIATTAANQPKATAKVATGTPLTLTAFVATGDAICAHLTRQLATLPVSTPEGFAAAMPKAAAFEQEQYIALAKLVPPANLVNEWGQALAATQLWAYLSLLYGEYLRTHKFGLKAPQIQDINATQENFVKIARRHGFKQCSKL
jgi:hypothetical protein